MTIIPEWWKEGTVVRVTDFDKCDLVPQQGEWGNIDVIGMLGKPDTRFERTECHWREFITFDARIVGPGVSKQHPNGWYWVNVAGVEPVVAHEET